MILIFVLKVLLTKLWWCIQAYISNDYKYCVDLVLKKFLDTVIKILSRTMKDNRVISLIHKYLFCRIMMDSRYENCEHRIDQSELCLPVKQFDVSWIDHIISIP